MMEKVAPSTYEYVNMSGEYMNNASMDGGYS
jgi:hypothetical protein